jgi:hypothetical protein
VTPEPVPRLRAFTVTANRCRAKGCKRSATIKLTPDRLAQISLRVDRQTCDARRRCHWTRVLTKTLAATTRGASVVVRGSHGSSLRLGSYRAVAVPSSSAGAGKSVTKPFKVR